MKTIAEIYTCECGKNIIILDENFENATDTENMECPVCGGEMVSEMIREIDINKVSSTTNTEVEIEREEKTLWKGKYLALKNIAEIFLEECEYNYPELNDQDRFEEMRNKFYELTEDD